MIHCIALYGSAAATAVLFIGILTALERMIKMNGVEIRFYAFLVSCFVGLGFIFSQSSAKLPDDHRCIEMRAAIEEAVDSGLLSRKAANRFFQRCNHYYQEFPQ